MPFSLNRSFFMQRDRLLISEIVDASQRIIELTEGASTDVLDRDRDRRDHNYWQVDSNVLLSISQDDVPRLLLCARLAHLEGSVSR